MARTGFFHHIGTFMLFAACILLLITDISSPTVNHLAMLKVRLGNATDTNDSALTFGSFGYCLVHVPDSDGNNVDYCTHSKVGYNPATAIEAVGAGSFDDDSSSSSSVANEVSEIFSSGETKTVHGLTKVMILHPIATGIFFVAFLLSAGAGMIGSFMAAFVALIGFLATIVVLITDFVLFALVRRKVNGDDDTSGATAAFGPAIWTVVAGAACALVGTIVIFLTCCSARMHERRGAPAKMEPGFVQRRRRWF